MPPRTRISTAASDAVSSTRSSSADGQKKAAAASAPAKKAAKAVPAKKATAHESAKASVAHQPVNAAKKAAPAEHVDKQAAKKAAPAKTTSHAPAKKAAPAEHVDKKAAKKAAPVAHHVPAKQASAPVKAPAKGSAQHSSAMASASYAEDARFLQLQREALLAERATYLEQAENLQAEALSLVEEMEPGDVQFDEESGEGGTVTVDRERDLALSAQALAAVEEIDAALERIRTGRYGICEGCGELIPKPRLEALPYARLCIACKSGGLSRR